MEHSKPSVPHATARPRESIEVAISRANTPDHNKDRAAVYRASRFSTRQKEASRAGTAALGGRYKQHSGDPMGSFHSR